jgi:hypothetical protein
MLAAAQQMLALSVIPAVIKGRICTEHYATSTSENEAKDRSYVKKREKTD